MFRIKTFNAIAERGLTRFGSERYTVGPDLADPHAVLLRSHPLAPDALTESLRAVARAGAGVNNVPVDACTERGIVVFNTPGANANSVKELVMAALLLSSRDLVGGIDYVRSLSEITDSAALDREVEANKKRFKGRELQGKSLGVVGLGAIGSLVAHAALSMGMEVLGHDPAISVDAAWRLPAQVQRMEGLAGLLSRSDFISLHVPVLPATRGLIDADALAACRKGAVLLNYARGPIVDTGAVKRALDAGQLSMYLADFPVPELVAHPRARFTPHLGASTREAEENCAVMAANQLMDFLQAGNIVNSVNFPRAQLEPSSGVRLAVTNRNVPGTLGQITAAIAADGLNVVDMLNKSRGDIAYNLIDVADPPQEGLMDRLADIDSVVDVRRFGPA